MKRRSNPFLEHDGIALRFERTPRGLHILAIDARGLELLRPLARSIELTDGVRAVTLYCDRVTVELEAVVLGATTPE
jgi:hypothetical protein